MDEESALPRIDLAEAYPNEPRPIPMEAEWPHAPGYQAVYRIGFQSMELLDLPKQLQIENVLVLQTNGPIVTRRTTVVQRPTAPLVWDKTTYPAVVVAEGLPLTVGHLAAFLPTGGEGQATFARWRDEIYSIVGLVASLVDDRIAHTEVFDDFLIYDERGAMTSLADQVLGLRNYLPFVLLEADQAVLQSLVELAPPRNVTTAARWYLRAAQLGPAADGIAYLWTCLEALTQAEGRHVVNRVQDALREAGEDPDHLRPTLGRIWGERARIVHFGETEPNETMLDGWYVLERVSRVLLRALIGVETTWPASPGDLDALPADVRRLWTETPRTEWHDE